MFRLTWQWTVLTLLGVACVTLSNLEGSAPTSPRPSAAPESKKPDKATTAKPEAPIENATVLPVDAIDGRVLAALQKRVDVEFIPITLEDLAAWASREGGFEVAFDRNALGEAHIDPNDHVKLTLRSVTLRTALDLSLAEYKMGYFVHNQALYLSTKERSQRATFVQVYSASDLVQPRRRLGRTIRDYRPLCETILAAVEPKSWQTLGDRVSISVCQGAISIRQTLEAHRQITELLQHLREARDRQLRGEIVSPPLPADAANAPVATALQKKVDVKCHQEPISEFATRLQKEFRLNVFVDETALREAEIDSHATEINYHVSAQPLSLAIDRVLDPFEMGFLVRDGVVILSTQRQILSKVVTRAYPIADLLEPESGGNSGDSTVKAHLVNAISKAAFTNSTASLPKVGMFKILDDWKILVVSQSDANHQRIAALLAALRSAKAVRNKSLPSTKKTDPTDDFELRVYSIERLANGDTPLAAAQAIESVIRETIARDSWSDRRALIKALPNRIVVRQQLAVHEEISDLLDQIAKPGGDELIEVVSN